MLAVIMATPFFGDLDWYVVNDTVMGGVSRSAVTAGAAVRFTGQLSLEQNGGFVSMRTRPGRLPLKVTLRGDGRTYDLTLRRADVGFRAGAYRVAVPTRDRPTTVEIPLSDFRPTSFGRPVTGAPALDAAPDRIAVIGFLLADGQAGPFELEVLDIEAVPGAHVRGAGYGSVVQALRAAVSAGVPAFNAGDHRRCRALYREALDAALLEVAALTPGERSVMAQALAEARAQADTEAAWTLRHAIDTVLWSARTVAGSSR